MSSSTKKDLSPCRSYGIVADWLEDNDSHTLMIDLPGVTKEDVKLDIIDGVTLEVTGRYPQETHCNVKWHSKERPIGAFRRTFQLPQNVLTSDLRAFDTDGILVVKVPKAKPS
ncbi:hypothetical protein KP509_1Z130700 [Ceratopteris richardii]|nr:hypothetical protein KP509_1Z130700 [Ceratopteris richardii]